MSTDELLRRLDELGAELKVRDRPERRAWNRLEPTRNGWTTRLYDDQAFSLWHEVLRRFPGDLSTVHHLAIMHHARAIDTEQSAHPGKSDEDWRQALAHWHRLFTANEFWAELAERVDATPDLMSQVREELAERLVGMHFDIALDERSPHHRARFHVGLALAAPFKAELVERVRVRTYERAIEGIDVAVWSKSGEPEELWPAIETVTHYLDLDDGCLPALTDLLKLLRQVQTVQIQHANGNIGEREGRRALDDIRATARKYDSYITRLEPLLLDASEKDSLVLSDLALWLSRTAQASSVREAYDESAGYYTRALRAARAGDDPRAEEFRVERLFAIVLAAREHAVNNREKAKELLAGIKKSERMPSVLLLTRAQAWASLGDFDRADADATDALAALDKPQTDMFTPHIGDPAELRAEGTRLRKQIEQIRSVKKLAPYLDKAAEEMRTGNWGEALRLMNAVLRTNDDFVPALIRRAECRLGLYEVDAAKADLDRAERLIRGAGGDEQSLAAVRELRQVHRTLRRQVAAAGGPKTARLQQEGIKAFNEGRHDKAIELLREARRVAGTRVQKLDEDLALCLNAKACKLVESITLGRHYDDPLIGMSTAFLKASGAPLDLVRRAEDLLEEAARLHSTQAVRQNLEQVRLLLRLRFEGRTW